MVSQRNVLINAVFPILFLGSAASLQLITSYLYLKSKPDFLLIILFFSLTSGIYLLNRVLDNEDKFNNLQRWRFFNETSERRNFWIIIALIALIVPVILPVMISKHSIALTLALISITGLFYSVKLLPSIHNRKILWLSIKDIPYAKPLVVCILWAGSALLIAAIDVKMHQLRADIIVIFSVMFISCLNSTLTSDVRDIDGDRLRKIYTIPALIGQNGTFLLLTSINIGAIITICVIYMLNVIDLKLLFFSISVIVWTSIAILPQYIKHQFLPKTVVELMVDSDAVISPISLAILSFV